MRVGSSEDKPSDPGSIPGASTVISTTCRCCTPRLQYVSTTGERGVGTFGGAATRVFLSTVNSAHPRVVALLRALRAADQLVTGSPLNPALGDDPRWPDWYRHGCNVAVEGVDAFVAVVTDGYTSSTWMMCELDTAWRLWSQRRRPLLFMLKQNDDPLPLGFRMYEAAITLLPMDGDQAVAALVLGRA